MADRNICFIGAGNMAEAMVSGLVESGTLRPGQVTVTDIRTERLNLLKKKYSVKISRDNRGTAGSSSTVVLAVKPQAIDGVLSELKGSIGKKTLVLSIAAGVTTGHIERFLGRVPAIRVMPNTPALVKKGMSGMCRGKYAGKSHEIEAQALLSSFGKVMIVPERMMNALTAVSGSGPAYVFYLAESMARSAEALGFSPVQARTLVNQTLSGAATMLSCSDDTAQALRLKVTSPGGTTEQAIRHFDSKKLSLTIQQGIARACRRAKELAR